LSADDLAAALELKRKRHNERVAKWSKKDKLTGDPKRRRAKLDRQLAKRQKMRDNETVEEKAARNAVSTEALRKRVAAMTPAQLAARTAYKTEWRRQNSKKRG
jgi:hypothetical protein